MYEQLTFRFKNSIEYEFKFKGKYGAKGEKRAARKKATEEQVEKQNQKNKENRTRRLIMANFAEGDLWCCLKYPAGTRKTVEEFKKDREKFFRALRRAYNKHNAELKFIYRMEVGEQGGFHFHIICNRIAGADTDILITKAWEKVLEKSVNVKKGLVDYMNLYEAGGFRDLAKYLCKKPDKNTEPKGYHQLSLFPEEERKVLTSVHSSKNLVRPEPEKKKCSVWTVRKLVENGPVPTPGYHIVKDSIHYGVNPYTGWTYFKYEEVRDG